MLLAPPLVTGETAVDGLFFATNAAESGREMVGFAEHLRVALAERYDVEREIARGGTAVVFLARDKKHHREVAVKVMLPELAESVGAPRFLREIEIAAGLRHPHILPVYDSGEADGFLYYVMPYVDGPSLRDRLADEGQLPLEDALRIASEVADALDYAHRHHVVHRDIKPENILYADGHALVTDFGFAHLLEGVNGDRITKPGLTPGTPHYMSPEQGTGSKLDGRSDLYSLGCVLFEMLAGEPPFSGRNPRSIIAKHVQERHPSIRLWRPDIPERVEAVVDTLLAKSPADRPGTASTVTQTLRRLESGESIIMPIRRRRRRRAVGAMVASVALAAMFGIWQPWGPELDPNRYVLAYTTQDDIDPERFAELRFYAQDALSKVPSITLVENAQIEDRMPQRAGVGYSLDDFFRAAKQFGAGRLLHLEVTPLTDSVIVRLVEHDVRDERRRDDVSEAMTLSIPAIQREIPAMVEYYFGLPPGVLGSRLSPLTSATRAFIAGRTALERAWDLQTAEMDFRRAIALDDGFARAHFWLAQTLVWAGASEEDWREPARRAQQMRDSLAAGERDIAAPLYAMATQDYRRACQLYEALVLDNPENVQAWIGLGDCHRKDQLVIPDSASRTGWSFRSSFHRAVEAYRQGLTLLPSFNNVFARRSFEPLQEVLPLAINHLRGGRNDTSVAVTMAAFPELSGDTLAFVPYPVEAVLGFVEGTVPTTRAQAVAQARQDFLDLVARWVDRAPELSVAHAVYALALEAIGLLQGPPGRTRYALTSFRQGRRYAQTQSDSVTAMLGEIRVLLRLGAWTSAASLADSALSIWTRPLPENARALAGVALLLGRVNRSADLVVLGALETQASSEEPDLRNLRPGAFRSREQLLVHAAAGANANDLDRLFGNTDDAAREGGADLSASSYAAVFDQAAGMAFPWIGPSAVHELDPSVVSDMVEMQGALARDDTARTVARLRDLALRRGSQPGAGQRMFLESYLWAQAGDSSRALAVVDATSPDRPELSVTFFDSVVDPPGFVHSLLLGARLAMALDRGEDAIRWVGVVRHLWSDADPQLREQLRETENLINRQMR